MALFGYSNPDITNKHQDEIKDDANIGYSVSLKRGMEIYEETKNKFGDIQRANPQELLNKWLYN